MAPKEESVEAEGALVKSEPTPFETDSTSVCSTGFPAGAEQVNLSSNLLLAEKEEEVERPKSPWTPSYSVITQGKRESEAVDHLVEPKDEILSPAKESTPEIVVGHVEVEELAEGSSAVPVNADVTHVDSSDGLIQEGKQTKQGNVASEVSKRSTLGMDFVFTGYV
jgi:hypothetical protein